MLNRPWFWDWFVNSIEKAFENGWGAKSLLQMGEQMMFSTPCNRKIRKKASKKQSLRVNKKKLEWLFGKPPFWCSEQHNQKHLLTRYRVPWISVIHVYQSNYPMDEMSFTKRQGTTLHGHKLFQKHGVLCHIVGFFGGGHRHHIWDGKKRCWWSSVFGFAKSTFVCFVLPISLFSYLDAVK